MYPRGRYTPPACTGPCCVRFDDVRSEQHTAAAAAHALVLAQTLALMQWRAGRLREAREIFQEAVSNCPPHAPLWAAWANMEVRDDVMIR